MAIVMAEGTVAQVSEAPRPAFGRGLSRQYSIYPSKPSLKTLRGALTAAIDVIKFLYTNEFTRSVWGRGYYGRGYSL